MINKIKNGISGKTKVMNGLTINEINSKVGNIFDHDEFKKGVSDGFIKSKNGLEYMTIPNGDMEVFKKDFDELGNKLKIFKNDRGTYGILIGKDAYHDSTDTPLDKKNFSDFRMYGYYKFKEENIKEIIEGISKIKDIKEVENFIFFYTYLGN